MKAEKYLKLDFLIDKKLYSATYIIIFISKREIFGSDLTLNTIKKTVLLIKHFH